MFIGDQLEECKDYSGLFYVLPFQKGFLVNWDVEKQVWDYMFGKEVMKVIEYVLLPYTTVCSGGKFDNWCFAHNCLSRVYNCDDQS